MKLVSLEACMDPLPFKMELKSEADRDSTRGQSNLMEVHFFLFGHFEVNTETRTRICLSGRAGPVHPKAPR